MLLLSRQIIFCSLIFAFSYWSSTQAEHVVGCGGFVQSEVDINYSLIQMKLLTKQGIIKSQTECAPNNGYFLIPVYDKGTFVLKIEPPIGWSFDPNSVELNIDGTTDKCSKGEDINFISTGFTLSGKAASKESFILSPLEEKKGDFQALKLGRIDIVVRDDNNQPLSAVLLSLSAPQFRSNNLTLDNGTMVFTNLGPGQYFFRPMLKEYTFSPRSQMIDIDERTTVNMLVKGKRVAFSCFGQILSLDGEPEKGIAIEAVGLDSCESFQEETVSDQDGQYRLRGLQPGCMHRVRVKTGDSNPHIERASPSFIDVQVSGSDLQNVNMIAFRHVNQFEITGNVVTDSQFISSLKVTLSPENNPDTPVFTTPVSMASYFQFPSVPNDGLVYIVRLVSSLSTLNYNYIRPEFTVTATGVQAHVTFKFEPQPRKAEPDPS